MPKEEVSIPITEANTVSITIFTLLKNNNPGAFTYLQMKRTHSYRLLGYENIEETEYPDRYRKNIIKYTI